MPRVLIPTVALAALAIVLSLALLVGGTTAQTGPTPKQLADFAETNTLLVPEWHELAAWPRGTTPGSGQDSWRTDTLTPLQVGPVDLEAGDILDVRLEHEFDAEMPGAGAWTVPTACEAVAQRARTRRERRRARRVLRLKRLGVSTATATCNVQSEHWFLWIMSSTSARLRCNGVVVATDVLHTKETNWDWLTHHLPVMRSGHYVVQQDLSNCYVQDRVYFKSGMSYTRPEPENRRVQINGGPYPRLSLAVYR
jgi:hypothetical protein